MLVSNIHSFTIGALGLIRTDAGFPLAYKASAIGHYATRAYSTLVCGQPGPEGPFPTSGPCRASVHVKGDLFSQDRAPAYFHLAYTFIIIYTLQNFR